MPFTYNPPRGQQLQTPDQIGRGTWHRISSELPVPVIVAGAENNDPLHKRYDAWHPGPAGQKVKDAPPLRQVEPVNTQPAKKSRQHPGGSLAFLGTGSQVRAAMGARLCAFMNFLAATAAPDHGGHLFGRQAF